MPPNRETWIGSMRFPFVGGRALLGPRCYNTVEIYGPPIAPRDIPYWKVTLNPPQGDGKAATVTDDGLLAFHRQLPAIPVSRTTRTVPSSTKSGWIISPPTGERTDRSRCTESFLPKEHQNLEDFVRQLMDSAAYTA